MKEDPYLAVKKHLAHEAAALVQPGMIIGLGSGSTSQEFIKALAERSQKESLDIFSVASSKESYVLAKSLHLRLLEDNEFNKIDLAVDGADEVDTQLRMIKGGGGAVFREKIVLQASLQRLILVDESKEVKMLGKYGLPIEISPFGCQSIIAKLEDMGYLGKLRYTQSDKLFITNNGNYIYDVHTPNCYSDPEEDLKKIAQIHGIIEVGFVIANVEVWVGYTNGQIKKMNSGKI